MYQSKIGWWFNLWKDKPISLIWYRFFVFLYKKFNTTEFYSQIGIMNNLLLKIIT